MKEIGGYFGLDENGGREYYPNALAFNTARNCLRFLIRHHGIKQIAIPDYNCEAVEKAIQKEDCDYYFYPVGRDLIPDISKVEDSDWLYIVNYYGQNSEFIDAVITAHKNVIVDNVQAFFTEPFTAVPTIFTCRKFFGVSDGAYLAVDDYKLSNAYSELPKDKSADRLSAVMGRYEDSASEHFSEYQKIEDGLDDQPIRKMSRVTQWLLRGIDYEAVLSRRNENFRYLKKQLQDINELSVIDNRGPYAYPLLVENGEGIRNFLISKKIYVPMLWPNVFASGDRGSDAFYLASNLLPIPCDQRYNVEDMKQVVKLIKTAVKGEY